MSKGSGSSFSTQRRKVAKTQRANPRGRGFCPLVEGSQKNLRGSLDFL
jgi:hypothetical protein